MVISSLGTVNILPHKERCVTAFKAALLVAAALPSGDKIHKTILLASSVSIVTILVFLPLVHD